MEAPRVTYRILDGDSEWERIHAFFHKLRYRTDIIPFPKFSRAIVAEFEGEIIACYFMQVTIHFEPLVLDAAHAGRVHLRSLQSKAEEALASSAFHDMPYFCFIDDERVARIAELCGLSKIEGVSVWSRNPANDFVAGKDAKNSTEAA